MVTVIEDTASNLDLSAATVADPDVGDTLTVTLTASAGTMTASSGGGVTVGGSGSGTLILSGAATDIDSYLNTASNIQYTGAADANGDNAATIAVTVQDDGGSAVINAGTINVDITNVNDPPSLDVNTGLTVDEGAADTVITAAMLSTSDVDTGDTLTYTVTALPNNGTLKVDGVALGVNGTFTQAQIAAGKVSYSHDGSETTTDSFTFTVSDGNGGTVGATPFTITVTPQNDSPVFSGLDGAPTFIEGGTPVQLDADVMISDAELEGSSFDGATLTIVRDTGADSADLFANMGNLAALTEGGALVLSGETIGTVTTNSAGTLLLTFNASANKAKVTEVMRSITYANASDDPSSSAQLKWTFSDGNTGAQGVGGALTATGFTTVGITAVNDPPTVTPAGPPPLDGYTENGGAVSLFNLGSISTVESGQGIASFAFTVTGVTDGADEVVTIGGTEFALNGTGGTAGGHTVAITDDTVTVTFGTPQTGSAAVSFINAITYRNTSEAPTAGNREFTLMTVTDTGGGADTAYPTLVRPVTVTPVNDTPVISNLGGDTQTFSIGGAAVRLDTGAAVAVTDVDHATLASATVQITGNYTSTEDVLAFTGDPATMGNIAGVWDAGSGTLTLTSAGATATHHAVERRPGCRDLRQYQCRCRFRQ